MEIFDFFMLIFEQRNTHGLSMALVYLLPPSLILTTLNHLRRHYRPAKHRPMATACHGLDSRSLHQHHNAVRDFDREVKAWEQAAQQVGRKL